MVTTLLDHHHHHPARDLVALYHQRWEIETAYLELKSTVLGGRVLRARTPDGIDQEIHALLITHQALRTDMEALRTAMADAAHHLRIPPDRAGFTVAPHTARDQVVHAAGVITGTTVDLVGRISHAVLTHLLPPRRSRTCPRVVKRAISKHRAKGTLDRTNHRTTIHIMITTGLTTDSPPQLRGIGASGALVSGVERGGVAAGEGAGLVPAGTHVDVAAGGFGVLVTERGLRSGADAIMPSRWLFPGGQLGRQNSTQQPEQRLGQLGIRPDQARTTALFQLATEIPAAILARTLGISVSSAVRRQ
ncbi:transposase [Actinosynnema sp. NPDC023587]|uniref:transposase n=1 Tax=Actinosynnema sp. NPDC023587 TaxID=3154695 RepID=UPI0033CCAB45